MELPFDREKLNQVGEIYTPSFPVEIRDLFAGRTEQFSKAFGILPQKGLHAVIYGDRGVGKTSFSNIIKILFQDPNTPVFKISCNTDDTFDALWKNVLSGFTVKKETIKERASFVKDQEVIEETICLGDYIDKSHALETAKILQLLAVLDRCVIILDEFDRLDNAIFSKKLFTDTLKAISDSLPNVTLVIVGVSEDISTLIDEHQSIERNLSQIYMPTMSPKEIKEIIEKGEEPLGIKFEPAVVEKIIKLASGYPHFAHSLCYHSAHSAIILNESVITETFLTIAIKQTLDNAHESLRNSYREATLATKKNIFSEVLLAASLVETDEYGYFQAIDLEEILSDILQEDVKVNKYVSHLGKFCTIERGEILRVTGSKNRQRYKFKNPLMKAFIKLKRENETKS